MKQTLGSGVVAMRPSLKAIIMLLIPLVLSAYTHLSNPIGFPSVHVDEEHLMRRAMIVMGGTSPQEPNPPVGTHLYDHPFFGQLFLSSIFGTIGYPNSILALSSYPGINGALDSVESLHLFPRILMGLLAVLDTLFIYKIAKLRYNRNVAFIASVLFAVMPVTLLTRWVLLDSILLPFFLSSILFALYLKEIRRDGTNFSMLTHNKIDSMHGISLILLSGILLGLAIFTKIPAFTMIPLIAYLVFTNSNTNRLKNLALWFIPVITIPLIWPAYAIFVGEFDEWWDGVLWQISDRNHRPLLDAIFTFFKFDPVLFTIGLAGLSFSFAVNKEAFLFLTVVPFLLFFYLIDFVSYWHIIPIIPGFCIAAALLVDKISSRISRHKSAAQQQILPFLIISAIAVFGLMSTTQLINIDLTSFYFKTLAYVISNVPAEGNDKYDKVTVAGDIYYQLIPKYVYDKNIDYREVKRLGQLETEKILLVADKSFIRQMSNTKDAENSQKVKRIYDNTNTVATIGREIPPIDRNVYPYSVLSSITKYTLESSKTEIRTNHDVQYKMTTRMPSLE